MMFVPFTGIDNHGRCVTFAAGLIRDEKAETYTWLLNCFMRSFNKDPTMMVTDQDKSMEIAIKSVFKTTKHRLCRWHITQKLQIKVKEAIPSIEEESERDFKRRFDNIVWNMYIEPHVFEEQWDKLKSDFSLKNDTWFKYMFQIRSKWIPAYFTETPMFGLMRTTSRSTQEKLDADDIKKSRTLCTKLKIEKHASKIYTKTVFEIVQKEIEASLYACSVDQMTIEGDCKVYLVNEKLEKKALDTRKNVIQIQDLRSRQNRFDNANMGTQRLVTDVTSVVEDCLHLLVNGEKKLEEFLEQVKDLKKKVEDEMPKQPSKKKDDIIEKMTGVSKPDTNRIKNPPVDTYKGCYRDKRLMGGKEKGLKESNKRKSNCSMWRDRSQHEDLWKKETKSELETTPCWAVGLHINSTPGLKQRFWTINFDFTQIQYIDIVQH
uniref:protein FAR1-RELATED SEQUENCE 5-like n=1 Tax=Erigeron canadensis TaxID=72917 RepID=UPI001CB8F441|nr:protein FAR1-RELATED SEQUENCE 5-like [Erigeron canadensis]